MEGRVFSVNISSEKGQPKKIAKEARLVAGEGFEGDAHSGPGKRQVSLLSIEQIEDFESKISPARGDLGPGAFGENITTEGLDLRRLKEGDRLFLSSGAVLRVSQLGKACHGSCVVRQRTGSCIMPKQGIFAEVEQGGAVRSRDSIKVIPAKKGFWPW